MDRSSAIDLIKKLYLLFNESKYEEIDNLIKVDKFNSYMSNKGDVLETFSLNFYAWKNKMLMDRKAFPNLQYILEDILFDQPKLIVRGRKKGKNSGETGFFPATNKEIDISFISIYEVSNESKILMNWHVEDELTAFIKMGICKLEFKSDNDIKTSFGDNTGFPLNSKEITNEWLTKVLKQEKIIEENSSVTNIELEVIDAGFIGETVRLKTKIEGGSKDQLNFVAKFSSPNTVLKNSVNKLKVFQREVYIYKTLSKSFPVELAKCYFGDVNESTGDHCLIMEDLKDRGMKSGEMVEGTDVENVKLVLENFSKLHAHFWDNHPEGSEWMNHSKFLFHLKNFYLQAYETAKQLFIDQQSSNVSKEFISVISVFQPEKHLEKLMNRKKFLTLIQGDTHLNNTMFYPERKGVLLIDWQACSYSICVRDAVNFIGLSLHHHLIPENLANLKSFYFDCLKKNAKSGSTLEKEYTRELFEEDWKDALKLIFFVNCVAYSNQTAQKPNPNDPPQAQKRYNVCVALQKRLITILETEGIKNIFSNIL